MGPDLAPQATHLGSIILRAGRPRWFRLVNLGGSSGRILVNVEPGRPLVTYRRMKELWSPSLVLSGLPCLSDWRHSVSKGLYSGAYWIL